MRGRRFYVLSAVFCGLLWALAWPAVGGFTPLVFFAWVPLLLAEERFANSERSARPRHFMPYVFLALAIWNACTTWWLYCVQEPAGVKWFSVIGPNIGNDLVMCVPWALMRRMRVWWGGRTARWCLVILWTAFEQFHMNWDLSWPWLTIGNAFADRPWWIQWYEITGHLGGTVWVLCVNVLLVQWILAVRSREPNAARRVFAPALLILIPLVLSLVRYSTFKEEGTPTEVVIVQPNIDPYVDKFGGLDPLLQVDHMLAQADSLITPSTALLVLPETALQEPFTWDVSSGVPRMVGLWENDLPHAQSVIRIQAFLKKHPGMSVLTGMSSGRLYPPGAELPITARVINEEGQGFDAYNAALFIRPDGSTEPYHKSKLVPGVEKLPFETLLGPLAGLVAVDMGGTTGSLGIQEEREVMATADGKLKLAPIICYESIYGEHVAAHVRNGATLLTIMTNDGWWDDTPAHWQHLAYGRLRAVETRRSIARSANTGISCFIDQRGDVFDAARWWVPATRRATLLARTDLTFFVQHGNIIGKVSEAVAIILVLGGLALALVRRLTRQ